MTGQVILHADKALLPIGTTQSGTSHSDCTIRISLPPGMRVNLTIHNYSPPPAFDQLMATSSACYEIGSVKEKDVIQSIHKCLSDPRQKQIYLSTDGAVDVTIPNSIDTNVVGNFILEYKGKQL